MRPTDLDTDRRPFVLVWEVTQACDLACDHCRADATPERHPQELSTGEGKALLDEAGRFGADGDDQLVVLSGGDPMKRPDIPELVRYGTNAGCRMTLTPSGTDGLDREMLAILHGRGLQRLALSLDGGDAASHDAFRGEAGSFETTVRAAEHARELGLPLQVNTTVCAQTVDQLPAIRELVRELGAVLWSVFFLVPVGRGTALDSISPERAERVMNWLHDVNDDAPFAVKTTEAPSYRRVAIQRLRERVGESDRQTPPTTPNGAMERRTGIVAGDGFAFVSHVGEVYPSGFLPESAGTVREESVVDIYRESELFRRLRDRDALSGKCGACEFRGVCGGSRSRAYAHTGDPLASDPLCSYVPEGYDGPLPGPEHESVDFASGD
ncbi:TIGR04053 family radical SAM/SPASM domain-containing protein [Haloglomus halophilum]|uniref:TIGR04053 family radical SAM/SPASM domain-containing protein n=1 Tax=Haloglomus halophilum TaxID=2962672 RepID=UPI0020CA0FA4|nr:TIGR04053 family radical SAM/SPASM domain-containing protein [Haloglomus halophilum]